MRDLHGKKILVAGLAKSGLAAIDLALEKGATVSATDSSADAAAKLAGRAAGFSVQADEKFEGYDWIVLSPGVPADLPQLQSARARGIPVIGDVEFASWYLEGPIMGITGSNGKTTTTALTGHILRECGIASQVGGNIGTAPASMAAASRPDRWNVLELSSFQLETIDTFRARAGACLNVTPDHLDRHHTFENYADAKGRLFDALEPSGAAVLNADDETCAAYAARTQARPLWFSSSRELESGIYLDGDRLISNREEILRTSDTRLRGRHNLENIMAAALLAGFAGASKEGIRAAVRSFEGVEHRLEFVRALDGVEYYNDSKATNVDATLKAVAAFPPTLQHGLWIILGGKDKGSDYTPLREPLRQAAKGALLIGAAAEKIACQLSGAVPLIDCGTLAKAISEARRLAAPGDTAVLAPACASFDQFDNYEHRGRVFKEIVLALGSK